MKRKRSVVHQRAWKLSKVKRVVDGQIEIIEGELVERVTDAVDRVVRETESGNAKESGFGYISLKPKDFTLVGRLRAYRDVKYT